MKVAETLKAHINDAHGDGYDTVELSIEDARSILAKLEQAEKALDAIANCGEDRPDAYPLINLADEALEKLREK